MRTFRELLDTNDANNSLGPLLISVIIAIVVAIVMSAIVITASHHGLSTG